MFRLPPTSGPKATIILRLMAGAVFFWEGLLKFAYANQGVGQFSKLGMPMPEVPAPAIAVLPAARAIRPAGHGGWAVLHEIRSEYAQIMTCIYLLAAGPGPWSLDALLLRRRRASAVEGSSAAFPSSALRPQSQRLVRWN
jgi:putative oxidoreductase